MMSGEGGSHHPRTDTESRSIMSPEFTRPGVERLDSVAPADSASHHGRDSPEPSAVTGVTSPPIESTPFPFKFKAPHGRMHRLQVVASAGMSELIATVAEKLGGEADDIGGVPAFEEGKLGHAGFALSYLDNEGDTVSITTDRDLLEAITMAREGGRDKVDLFVHHPDQPPIPATLAPQPALTPLESTPRARKTYNHEDEDVAEVEERRRERRPVSSHGKSQEQLIAGVPNDLLLPGAIVTLAVVIISVFTIARATSK